MEPAELPPVDDGREWEHRLLPVLLIAFGVAVGATLGAIPKHKRAVQTREPSSPAVVTTASFLSAFHHHDDQMTAVQVADVVAADGENTSVVLLADRGSEHVLPLFLSAGDGGVVERQLRGKGGQLSDPAGLLRQSVEALGGVVDRVEISDRDQDELAGRVIIRREGAEVALDASPSDALALAVTAGVPVYVPNRMLSDQGIDRESLKEAPTGLPSTLKAPQRL